MRLHNVRLGAALRARLSHAFFDATELSAEAAELGLPGWREPLRLRLRRVRVELQQRALPQVPPARHPGLSRRQGPEPWASHWGAPPRGRQHC